MTNTETQLTVEQTVSSPDEHDTQYYSKLPRLLRSIGAFAVLLSLYTFLVRGWEGSSDLVRYIMLLGHTGLLTGVAITSGHFLREGKGARLLLMLSLVSTVVNFAVLGAFLFSTTADVSMAIYPHYVAWSVGSTSVAITITLIALVVLIPVILFGFRALVRGMSTRMSMLFIFSNLALLIPVREPALVSAIAVALGMFTLGITVKTSQQRCESMTFEGMVALLLQFLPAGVLLVRNVWLYSPDTILFAAISAVLFVALRQSSYMISDDSRFGSLCDSVSVFLAAMTGICLGSIITDTGLSGSLALMTGTMIASGMCYELSTRAFRHSNVYRMIAASMITAGVLANLLLYGGLPASILALGMGIGGIAFSYTVQQRSILISGIVMVVAGLIEQSLHFFQVFDFGYWVTLAISGVMAIVLASVLESRGGYLKQKYQYWKHRVSGWSY